MGLDDRNLVLIIWKLGVVARWSWIVVKWRQIWNLRFNEIVVVQDILWLVMGLFIWLEGFLEGRFFIWLVLEVRFLRTPFLEHLLDQAGRGRFSLASTGLTLVVDGLLMRLNLTWSNARLRHTVLMLIFCLILRRSLMVSNNVIAWSFISANLVVRLNEAALCCPWVIPIRLPIISSKSVN